MAFIFPIYSYHKGDTHKGDPVTENTPLSIGQWRITFNVSSLYPDFMFPTEKREWTQKDAPELPADKVLGKKVKLLYLETDPKKDMVKVIVDIKENPIPIALIGGGILAVGIIAGLFLSLDKVEKIMRLPSTYLLVGLGALIFFQFR